ncbi:MAG: DUF4974 domain-containing protein [Chitinophagaceae bacterium]|nr:DUF4974 domain-containing protein [Chitinophagaceae bacterium]MCW5929542.1 DUF4974 domain-containing protein [Chitinophagaceae bacterium]
MKKNKAYYRDLMSRYLNNECDAKELEEILNYIGKDDANRLLLEQMQAAYKASLQNDNLPDTSGWSDRIRAKLLNNISTATIIPFYKRRIFQAAAVFFLLLSTGTFFYFNSNQKTGAGDIVSEIKQDIILPGSDKATLTLADGSVIDLNEAGNQDIALQGSTKVTVAKGMLNYTAANTGSNETVYNTITTPRGGQYAVILSDGSRVWLNAASSLKFPASFIGSERKVELSGEGYFEITPHTLPGGKKEPFNVTIQSASGNGGTVEVLGTHFNVMAYDEEEQINTTLLEGAVKVNIGEKSLLLKPGQQAHVTKAGQEVALLTDVDIKNVIAWKDGEFRFDNTDVKTIMRQIARWYDVNIVYEGHVPEIGLSGSVKRKDSIEQMLEILEATHKIRFRTEGKNVLVTAYKKQ